MPAYDVDFAGAPGVNPERDRVSFNGHVVPGEFLTGSDSIWKLNSFNIPVEWINFPTDPGAGGTPTPADNLIRIDVDVLNSQDVWCTAIDWAALAIDVARPAVLVHGAFSSGATWNEMRFSWTNKLNEIGLPNNGTSLSMGVLPDLIQSNAVKIANEVARARQRWGVDKVNLICHSKGGLDARHFVENDNSVGRLIQIGTPNAGTPLADLVIRGTLRLPPVGAVAVNLIGALTAPGGYQLTTPYMTVYNFIHGHNTKVRYTALAGNYDAAGCSFFDAYCLLSRLLILAVGSGDVVVPFDSVHALGYTDNLRFDSAGNDEHAKHTPLVSSSKFALNASSRVFDLLFGRVGAIDTSHSLLATAAATVAPTASIVGTIRQGQVQSQTIRVDQATSTSFTLLYPSGNLDMALISPSGQRFDPVTIVGNPNVARDDQEILGGRMEIYSFNTLEIGTWTAEISAPAVIESSGEVPYLASAWLENSAISFKGTTERSSIHAGDRLRLFGTLKNNGQPLTGASVRAIIGLPDNTLRNLVLTDDGTGGDATPNDGVYTGDFTATSPAGNYRILFEAGRAAVSGVPAFTREDFAAATASRSSSTFTGTFRDFGEDTDGNGLFNNLVIEVGLKVNASANYRLMGILTDSHGNTHEANSQALLSAGVNTVSLKFDGERLFSNRVDGPYTLTAVRLAEENGGDIMPVDERTNAFQTAAYSFRSFEHGPLVLTGNGSAIGIDTNGNGLFDILRVGLEIDASVPGAYDWSARLSDRNGREIGFATNSASLVAGTNTLQLNYAGDAIGRNGVDGPYFINGLLVFGPGGSLVSSNAFTTSPFRATQFEGSCSMNISCPGPINVTAAATCPVATSAQVNFNVAVSGNCPVATLVCKNQNNVVVTSGSLFPVGTSAVNCTATDASGNTATCSFPVNVFSFCLQDETNPGNVVLVNANPNSNAAASYIVFCGGVPIASGQGTLTVRGCIGSLDHNKGDRRVHIQWDTSAQGGNGSGTAIVQVGPNNTTCQITDKNMVNNSCAGSGNQAPILGSRVGGTQFMQ